MLRSSISRPLCIFTAQFMIDKGALVLKVCMHPCVPQIGYVTVCNNIDVL